MVPVRKFDAQRRERGNLVLIGTSCELDEDTQDLLYAMGPHPAEVLTTDELRDLLDSLEA